MTSSEVLLAIIPSFVNFFLLGILFFAQKTALRDRPCRSEQESLISDKVAESNRQLLQAVRSLETEWEDTYEKLQKVAGRLSRRTWVESQREKAKGEAEENGSPAAPEVDFNQLSDKEKRLYLMRQARMRGV